MGGQRREVRDTERLVRVRKKQRDGGERGRGERCMEREGRERESQEETYRKREKVRW